jgi:hypothetical protein
MHRTASTPTLMYWADPIPATNIVSLGEIVRSTRSSSRRLRDSGGLSRMSRRLVAPVRKVLA